MYIDYGKRLGIDQKLLTRDRVGDRIVAGNVSHAPFLLLRPSLDSTFAALHDSRAMSPFASRVKI